MRHIYKILLFVFLFSNVQAQILTPVKWTYSSKKVSDCEAELIINAKVDKGWHLYSQDIADGGPVKTSFDFTKDNKNYELVGKVKESKTKKMQDPNFGMEIKFFEGNATFTQNIKLSSTKSFIIKGKLEFMVCDDHQCLPPEQLDFEINVDGAKDNCFAVVKETEKVEPVVQITKVDTVAKQPDTNSVSKKEIKQEVVAAAIVNEHSTQNRSILAIFILGFLAGLAALLTPCVFPMIPMTVSFFTKRSKTRAEGIRNAFTYAFSIIIIYVALGLGVTLLFGVDALNSLSTNVYMNLFFFALLIVFAVSFLGAFEIVLPSSFVNKMDAKSDKGGLIGIFFMAFTLSLVSFSCTGPLVGTVLFEAAANGGIVGPFWVMFGFSSALALPFGLFAAFPGWLNSLPKSGGWLNSVKVVLGFLELAWAFKFLSNADLVSQTGLLTREVFLVLWIVIFGLMGAYLMGWFKLSHDSDLPSLSVTRLFFAIITFSFTLYLIPGLWGAPLKLISGFPPPDFYSESPNGFGKQSISVNADKEIKTDGGHCPNNLPCYHDYNEALAEAKRTGKPLMIDFTGWACVNCRKMESQVWTDPEVDKRLRNDVVLVSLYVDEKIDLPLSEQREEKLGDKVFKIKTVGNKWSYFQASRYKTNSQPQYILLDHNEQMLNAPSSYDSDIQKYIKWLDEGKEAFAKLK